MSIDSSRSLLGELQPVLSALRERGYQPYPKANGEYKVKCPAHAGKRTDSLSVGLSADGSRVLLHCFSKCRCSDILGALNLQPSVLFPGTGAEVQQVSSEHFEWWDSVAWTGWNGRTGPTDRLIYYAGILLMLRANSTRFAGPIRTWAEIAGKNRDTAQIAVHRMVAMDWLRTVRPARGSKSNEYEFTPISHHRDTLLSVKSVISDRKMRIETKALLSMHDLFRERIGLGASAGLVLDTLVKEGPLSAQDLVTLTARAQATVYRALEKLQGWGIIGCSDSRYVVLNATPEYLDSVALEIPVIGPTSKRISGQPKPLLGARDRQKVRHDAERRLHREYSRSKYEELKREEEANGN